MQEGSFLVMRRTKADCLAGLLDAAYQLIAGEVKPGKTKDEKLDHEIHVGQVKEALRSGARFMRGGPYPQEGLLAYHEEFEKTG